MRRAADFVLALDEKISARRQPERPSYEIGALCFFYFLYQLIGDEKRPELTYEFLTRTSKWRSIRRRERYGLLAGAWAPRLSLAAIAAASRVDKVERYLRSVDVATVFPVTHQV